jgi:drug/metabolite transporter (DMT)-like permease
MKKHVSVYYPIAFAMIIIGVLMVSKVFNLESNQMNAINIGAAFLTLSSALVGSVTFIRISKVVYYLSSIFLVLGISLVFLGFLMPGFNVDFFLIDFLSKLDTNPLVLICLGITVASIMIFEEFIHNSLKQQEQEFQKQIIKLEKEKAELEKGLIRANSFIESIKGKRK